MKQDFFEPGVVYHVFNRGNNSEDLFKEDRNYLYFLTLLKKHLLPVVNVYAYCLMKNHFHLVVRLKDIEHLPDKFKQKPALAFSNLFNAYAKAMNRAYNRRGSLFQEHLHRLRIEDEEYLRQLIAYVHLNPTKHRFTDDFKSYRYSSYQAYVSGKTTNVDGDYVMSLFGDKLNFEYWHDLNKLYLEDKMEDV
jgi:putative transposase